MIWSLCVTRRLELNADHRYVWGYSPAIVSCGWSGSSGALPRRSPLRTGRAGFPRTSAQASR
jgi:hypothetical protein